MADRSRAFLKQEFDDGERPTGADFGDLIDSFINKEDDGVRLVGGNLTVPSGLTLGNTAAGQEGTLRFNGAQIELFTGGAFSPIGGGGAFGPVAGGPHVAFDGGNVGIGNFAAAPAHRLEVPLGPNADAGARVRFGNLVVHNGQANDAAYVSHENVTGDQNFALRQDSQANTALNAGPGAQLILSQEGTARVRVLATGNLSITPQASATIDGNTAIGSPTQARTLSVFGNTVVGSAAANANLSVFGQASKLGGGTFANLVSDARIKRDIKPFDIGIEELRRLNPVYYKFNGAAGTPNGDREYVGMIAQEVADVIPFVVENSEVTSDDPELGDLLTFDPGPLTYVLINAVRELAERVDQLESRLAVLEAVEE